ncbi:retrovirus-related pol polyprotein from transposon TNT 1-94 [Tanacetum coccineum]
MDINNALLHGDLNEEVYMKIPQGYSLSFPPNTVCKLTISHYSLKQANRQWFKKLTTFLLQLGFKQSYVDTSLFIIKDLAPLHYYLGIKFLRKSPGLAMTQRKYGLELLEYADVLNLKPISTPMDLILKLNETDGYVLPNPSTYKTLVEKLLYLVITRHDLSFTTQALTQYSHNPRSSHYDALIRVLRYINDSPVVLLLEDIVMSLDEESSRVTYTSVSSEFEEPSDAWITVACPEEPNSIRPSPDYVPDQSYPSYLPYLMLRSRSFKDQHYVADASPTTISQGLTIADSDRRRIRRRVRGWSPPLRSSAVETDESAAAPPPPPAYHTTSRMHVRSQGPIPFPSKAEVDRLLALPTPPPSPLTPLSSPLP